LYDGPGKGTQNRIVVTPLTVEIEETKRGMCGVGPSTSKLSIFHMSDLAKLELRGNKIRGHLSKDYLFKIDTYPCYATGCCAYSKGGFIIELPDNTACKKLFSSLEKVWSAQQLHMIC
jgi:hypothetical protein